MDLEFAWNTFDFIALVPPPFLEGGGVKFVTVLNYKIH